MELSEKEKQNALNEVRILAYLKKNLLPQVGLRFGFTYSNNLIVLLRS